MAIDKTILDSYRSGYSSYLTDLKSRNVTGKDYDEVERNYNRMLELGEECNDINEFNIKLNAENVMGNMQAAYMRAVLGNTPQAATNPAANARSQMAGGNMVGGTAGAVIDNVASAAQPLLYNVPGGRYVRPIVNLFKWVPGLINLFRNRRKNKNGDSKDGTAATGNTRVRRTS